jgi:hypothetical protein
MLLNRAGLLRGAEQQTAARVFMTAFLEATLHEDAAYRRVFTSPAGARNWLPDDVYVTQYEDASFKAVNTHDRLTKLENMEAVQAKVAYTGLIEPHKSSLSLRDGLAQQNNAFLAQWQAGDGSGSAPAYTLLLPQGADAGFTLDGSEHLVFALGNAMEEDTPVEVTVELEDAAGVIVALPVSEYGVIPPPLPARLEKSNRISKLLGSEFFPKLSTPYEQVLQSFEIPLRAFEAENPAFDAKQILAIRFRFDDRRAGRIYVDEVGFHG